MRRLEAHSDEDLTGSHSLREIWRQGGQAIQRTARSIMGVSVHNSGVIDHETATARWPPAGENGAGPARA